MVRRFQLLALGILCLCFCMGGECSRARVESMNKMNEGVLAAQQKRFMEAIKALELAGAIDGQNDQAFWNLALVHMEMNKFDRAKDDLQKAIAINPKAAGYHEKLGTVLIELKDWEGAKRAFEEAIKLGPELFKAYFKLAQVLERLDDQQNALRRYTESIQKGPRFLEAYTALGRLYAELNYLDQAAQVLQEAMKVALPGTEEGAHVHHMLGTVYQQKEKYDDAIREFRAALDVIPGMRDALFSLGWAYLMKGDKEEGARYLKKFVEVAGPETPAHYVNAARRKLNEMTEGFVK
jgi:tetratricopeptide (TPR) repeat protein